MLWLLGFACVVIVLMSLALRSEDRTIVALLHALDQSTDDAARWRMLADRFEAEGKVWAEIVDDRNGELSLVRMLLENELDRNEQLVLQVNAARRTRDGYKLLWQKALERQRSQSEGAKPQLALAK